MSTGVHRFFRELTREDLQHPNFSPNCANIVSGCTGTTEMADTSHERPSTALFFCRACANRSRGWEIDSWLQEGIGARVIRVIRVVDMGAAMEAHYIGGRTAILAQNTHAGGEGLRSFLCSVVNEQAQSAARLARLALGEG